MKIIMLYEVVNLCSDPRRRFTPCLLKYIVFASPVLDNVNGGLNGRYTLVVK